MRPCLRVGVTVSITVIVTVSVHNWYVECQSRTLREELDMTEGIWFCGINHAGWIDAYMNGRTQRFCQSCCLSICLMYPGDVWCLTTCVCVQPYRLTGELTPAEQACLSVWPSICLSFGIRRCLVSGHVCVSAALQAGGQLTGAARACLSVCLSVHLSVRLVESGGVWCLTTCVCAALQARGQLTRAAQSCLSVCPSVS